MKIKKVRPLLNHIITTANVYPSDNISLDENEVGEYKEYQTVLAVGPNVSSVKPGDIVVINPQAYTKPVHRQREDSIAGLMGSDTVDLMVQFPVLTINDTTCLFLYDRDVEFIIEDMEEDNDNTLLT